MTCKLYQASPHGMVHELAFMHDADAMQESLTHSNRGRHNYYFNSGAREPRWKVVRYTCTINKPNKLSIQYHKWRINGYYLLATLVAKPYKPLACRTSFQCLVCFHVLTASWETRISWWQCTHFFPHLVLICYFLFAAAPFLFFFQYVKSLDCLTYLFFCGYFFFWKLFTFYSKDIWFDLQFKFDIRTPHL